jgi:hypothetical protein
LKNELNTIGHLNENKISINYTSDCGFNINDFIKEFPSKDAGDARYIESIVKWNNYYIFYYHETNNNFYDFVVEDTFDKLLDKIHNVIEDFYSRF